FGGGMLSHAVGFLLAQADYNYAFRHHARQVAQYQVGVSLAFELRLEYSADGAFGGAVDDFCRRSQYAVGKDADAQRGGTNLLKACRGLCAKFHSDFP